MMARSPSWLSGDLLLAPHRVRGRPHRAPHRVRGRPHRANSGLAGTGTKRSSAWTPRGGRLGGRRLRAACPGTPAPVGHSSYIIALAKTLGAWRRYLNRGERWRDVSHSPWDYRSPRPDGTPP